MEMQTVVSKAKKSKRGMAAFFVTTGGCILLLGVLVAMAAASGNRAAATARVKLHTAESFAILAGSSITNVPVSAIRGDVGLSPSGWVPGLTCAEVKGSVYSVDGSGPLPCRQTKPALLVTAKNDLSTAYTDAAGRPAGTSYGAIDNTLGGKTLVSGVYNFGHAATANLIGTVTLDAKGDPDAVWIFQATSDLVTAAASRVALTNGAQPCNVFWQVSSSATLGTSSVFVGTILASTSVTLASGVAVDGQLLAKTGAVTLIMDTIRQRGCATSSPAATTTTAPATTTAPTTTAAAPATTTTTTTTAPAATTTAPAATTTAPTATTVPLVVAPAPVAKPKPKPTAKPKPAVKPKPKPAVAPPVKPTPPKAQPPVHAHGFTG